MDGRFPYDVSKSCADLIAQSYFTAYQLPVSIVRCGNLFGGGDWNVERLVPQTILSILIGNEPVIRSNGKRVLDFLYIEDAVQAHLLAAENSSSIGQAFNFSYETPISILAMVESITRLMKSELVPIVLGEEGSGGDQYLSAQKARKLLGWKPLYDIETGIIKTIEWYRKHYSG